MDTEHEVTTSFAAFLRVCFYIGLLTVLTFGVSCSKNDRTQIKEHQERAYKFIQKEDYTNALAELDSILSAEPKDSEAIKSKAWCLLRTDRDAEACRLFRKNYVDGGLLADFLYRGEYRVQGLLHGNKESWGEHRQGKLNAMISDAFYELHPELNPRKKVPTS